MSSFRTGCWENPSEKRRDDTRRNRLIVMGTGPFAVPTFRPARRRAAVLLLVTRPPRTLHGKLQAEVNPMREVARENGLPIFEPESINTADAQARLAAPSSPICSSSAITDRFFVPRRSRLRGWAGQLARFAAAQVSRGRADQLGDLSRRRETGDTVIHMTPLVDAGPAIAQARAAIGPDETAAEARAALGRSRRPRSSSRRSRRVAGTAHGSIRIRPRRRAHRLKKTDGLADWLRPAEALHNQIRALVPWPKTHTFWQSLDGRAATADSGKSAGRRGPRRTRHRARGRWRSTADRRRRRRWPSSKSSRPASGYSRLPSSSAAIRCERETGWASRRIFLPGRKPA